MADSTVDQQILMRAKSDPVRDWRLPAATLVVTVLLAVVTLSSTTLTGGATFASQAFNYIAGAIVFGSWWVWRGVVKRARWPLSGLELALGAAGIVALLSLANSPDRRVSAARLSELALLASLFYFTFDCLQAGLDRRILTRSLLAVTGVALVMALLHNGAIYLLNLGFPMLGKLGVSVGYATFMSFAIIVGNLHGFRTGEWKGASPQSIRWILAGIALLVLGVCVLALSFPLVKATTLRHSFPPYVATCPTAALMPSHTAELPADEMPSIAACNKLKSPVIG